MDEGFPLGGRKLCIFMWSKIVVVDEWPSRGWVTPLGRLRSCLSLSRVPRQSTDYHLMGELFSFGDRELVPPKTEYRSSQSIVISWTRESSWEIGSMFLLAAELVSLGRWSYDSWEV